MGVKLTSDTIVEINHDDLCAILTEHFCGGYGAFARMNVANVSEVDGANYFNLKFIPLPEEAA